ncbi:MAG: lmo0937 family membrane protein [bacterium]
MNTTQKKAGTGLFWAVAIVLLVLWLAGLLAGVGGPLVHILLVIALVLIIYRLAKGRKIP